MVQTRAAAKRIESSEIYEDHGLQTHVQSSSSKKRAEPAKRRRRGKPGELCRLNLDVLFLIAAYIHPIDLLNLARTCKSLRELLMSKASEFVWKTARNQVKGLPQCPTDLTEPEYANLVFHARCHGCGKYTKKVLWNIRRRYCTECKSKRLFPLGKCDRVITGDFLLPTETLQMADTTFTWVDKEQMELFMDEYNRSSDKDRLLDEKKAQYNAISRHVRECMIWERNISTDRKCALYARRGERGHSIFERLKQHGFQPEISYFGSYAIRKSNNSLFRTSKPLTDKEWAHVWPEWLTTLNELRLARLEKMVYQPRRDLLATAYTDYVAQAPPEMPLFDCLPHVRDLARLSPFEGIIKGPEGVQPGDKSLKSAFAQLPALVDEWRENFDSELAELVKIPDHLSIKSSSKGKGKGRLMTASDTSSHAALRKLKLASAVFVTDVISTYPEVLHTMHPRTCPTQNNYDTLSIGDRFKIEFLEDAPYIVHACGLDPNIATAEDMDNRLKATRLRCLVCVVRPLFAGWKEALLHADTDFHRNASSQAARWEAVSDHHVDAMPAGALEAIEGESLYTRCLLCRPHVGDAKLHFSTTIHLELLHDVKLPGVEPGVHYASVGIPGSER